MISPGFVAPTPFRTQALALFQGYLNAGAALDAARKWKIDTLIGALVTGGVWAKLDRLHVLAAPNSAAALLNWTTPGTNSAVVGGTPTFAAEVGYTGNGTDYINTTYTPSTSGGNFTQNSAGVACWTSTDVAQDAKDIGISSNTGANLTVAISGRTVANLFHGRINDGTPFTVASGSSIGYWACNRSASTARQFYKNGASIGSDATASSAVAAAPIALFRLAAERSTRQLRVSRVSGSLSAGEVAAEYTALNTYLSSI